MLRSSARTGIIGVLEVRGRLVVWNAHCQMSSTIAEFDYVSVNEDDPPQKLLE